MKLESTELTYMELKKLAETWAEEVGIRLHNIENRTESRIISRGKFKGKKRSVCHFLLRPLEGSDKYRKCSNRGTIREPKFARQAYACWVAYIQFAMELLRWWRDDGNEDVHIEMFAGGKRYNTKGKLCEYIELSWEEYYGSNASPSQVNIFNGVCGQQRMCMCQNGMIEGQTKRCDEY